MSKPIASKDFQAVNAKPLAGKVALVTRGSRGIGAAIARALADDGADVAVSYANSASKAEAVVSKLEAKGVHAKSFKADQAMPSRSKTWCRKSPRNSAVSISSSTMLACFPAAPSTTLLLTAPRSGVCLP